MDDEEPTEMIDLTRIGLAGLRKTKDLRDEVAKVLAQVERPRANLGGGGPPGRAD